MNLTTNLTEYRDQKFKELYKTYSNEGTTEVTLDEKLITRIPSGFRPEESCQKLFREIFEIAFHVGADRMLHIIENKKRSNC